MCVCSLRRDFLRWCMIGKRGLGRRPRTWYDGETVVIERLTVHSGSTVECQSTTIPSSRQSTSTIACCKCLNTAFWSVSWWLIYFTYKPVRFFPLSLLFSSCSFMCLPCSVVCMFWKHNLDIFFGMNLLDGKSGSYLFRYILSIIIPQLLFVLMCVTANCLTPYIWWGLNQGRIHRILFYFSVWPENGTRVSQGRNFYLE